APGGQTTPGAAPGAATGAAGATAAPVLQGAPTLPATTTAPSTSQDVVVPVWAVVLVVLLSLGAYGYAGWNHLRMRSASGRP
ncbi:hypothetical protein, partial [Nocardioides sp.]|uniref:hypothetical protein n=1 Tax=Nocardioides sp. TaxID=35761 RepID=UPI002716FA17